MEREDGVLMQGTTGSCTLALSASLNAHSWSDVREWKPADASDNVSNNNPGQNVGAWKHRGLRLGQHAMFIQRFKVVQAPLLHGVDGHLAEPAQ
jgi:hypothetical protein